MNYQETIDYLFNLAPLFQQVGGAAYKPGLKTTEFLDRHFGHPHHKYKTIHIAGTNGKGSCAHTLAAWFQLAGLKVGLYTSPHLIDFRERIRVNGEMIPQQRVIDFVESEKKIFEPLYPSFFEITTALAFQYFAEEEVDIAIIEVGLGGRLDCTNIISPILSIITNISKDHTQFLGNTTIEIAKEKAGIIKPNVPVVVGESTLEIAELFKVIADINHAPIIFAENNDEIRGVQPTCDGKVLYRTATFGDFIGSLSGEYQKKNANTILCAMSELMKLPMFSDLCDNLRKFIPAAFEQVKIVTGLRGRWEKIGSKPDIICDTGHNIGGWKYIAEQIKRAKYENKHIIFGMASDKDVESVLALMPSDAKYYFTKASVKRSLSEFELKEKANKYSLCGVTYPTVQLAFEAAKSAASQNDMIFVGGSNFVISDLLNYIE